MMNISYRTISLVEFMNSRRRHCRCPQTIGLNYVFSVCFGLVVFLPAIGIAVLCWSAASYFSVCSCDFVVAAVDVVVSTASLTCECCWLVHSPIKKNSK